MNSKAKHAATRQRGESNMNLKSYFTQKNPESSSTPSSDLYAPQPVAEPSLNVDDLPSDPALRKPIESFDVRFRDHVRREYMIRGPCQPIGHTFPPKQYGRENRYFQKTWFKEFEWLEYSISADSAFCHYCYLFKDKNKGVGKSGDDTFTQSGYCNWKKGKEKLNAHVGGNNSIHHHARILFQNFSNQRQSVSQVIRSHTYGQKADYRIRLTAALDVTRLLLKQGLPFRGHDESSTSLNKGNFLEFFDFLSERCEEVAKVVNQNAPGNCKTTSPQVQKDLTNACASEVTKSIITDLGDKVFSILVDESRDVSVKEQMALVLRYVNGAGQVIERLLSFVHVFDTSSASLKAAIDKLFSKHQLSMSKLRGQGYDGAANMRGEFNGLKSLILQDNPQAYYVHCFAHQLQLVVVAVSKTNRAVIDFFSYTTMIVNAVSVSCKRKDKLRKLENHRMLEEIQMGERSSGKGKNQETSLRRPGDTRWGSHFYTLSRLISMWPSVIEVLEDVSNDRFSDDGSLSAESLINKMGSYKFVFVLLLIKEILGNTNVLSQALQQKDQDILNAVNLIECTKKNLQGFREMGWENFFENVQTFCDKNMIPVLNMEDTFRSFIRNRRGGGGRTITNYHYYHVEVFCQVLDLIINEMNTRFPESSTELLRCIACFDPNNSFSKFNVDKLMRFVEFYPEDFSQSDFAIIPYELETFVTEMRHDERFFDIKDLGSLSQKLVQTKLHSVFSVVYRMIELALVLPVATATVERVFSAMKAVKTASRNTMGDEWMNDSLVVYIERDIFASIENEQILQYYQSSNNRIMQLSKLPQLKETGSTSILGKRK